LVESYIYYELDTNAVSDLVYDSNSKQLVGLQKQDRGAFKQSHYYYAFYDFDGSTGFDLFSRLNKADKEIVQRIAEYVARENK
jgi:hypothetical protein